MLQYTRSPPARDCAQNAQEENDVKELIEDDVFSDVLRFFRNARMFSFMIHIPGSEHTGNKSKIQAAITEKAYLSWNRAGVWVKRI